MDETDVAAKGVYLDKIAKSKKMTGPLVKREQNKEVTKGKPPKIWGRGPVGIFDIELGSFSHRLEVGMQFIGRTKGETRTHIYDNSKGYPIRVCCWAIPENDFIENGDAPLCKHCQAYKEGRRKVCFAPRVRGDK